MVFVALALQRDVVALGRAVVRSPNSRGSGRVEQPSEGAQVPRCGTRWGHHTMCGGLGGFGGLGFLTPLYLYDKN
jgi:hypothetical protein